MISFCINNIKKLPIVGILLLVGGVMLSSCQESLEDKAVRQAKEYTERYFELLAQCPPCPADEKKAENAKFANGLLENGGPAVNQFRKMLGDEKTTAFIRTCMFCCE